MQVASAHEFESRCHHDSSILARSMVSHIWDESNASSPDFSLSRYIYMRDITCIIITVAHHNILYETFNHACSKNTPEILAIKKGHHARDTVSLLWL